MVCILRELASASVVEVVGVNVVVIVGSTSVECGLDRSVVTGSDGRPAVCNYE